MIFDNFRRRCPTSEASICAGHHGRPAQPASAGCADAEQGYKDYDVTAWYGVVGNGHAGRRARQAGAGLCQAMRDPATAAKMERDGPFFRWVIVQLDSASRSAPGTTAGRPVFGRAQIKLRSNAGQGTYQSVPSTRRAGNDRRLGSAVSPHPECLPARRPRQQPCRLRSIDRGARRPITAVVASSRNTCCTYSALRAE